MKTAWDGRVGGVMVQGEKNRLLVTSEKINSGAPSSSIVCHTMVMGLKNQIHLYLLNE